MHFSSHLLRLGLVVLCFGILLSLCVVPAWSQATSAASISGQVKNAQGAPVPRAEVKLIDPGTGNAQTLLTNASGGYSFPQVQAGTYTITVTKQGFSVFRIAAQPLEEGSRLQVDAVLQAGAVTAFVDTPAVTVQSSGGAGAGSLSNRSLTSAPLLGNEAASMQVVAVGTTSSGSVAGAVSDQNRYMLDGGSNTDDMSGGEGSYVVNYTGLGGTQTGGQSGGVMPTSTESVEQVRSSVGDTSADQTNALGGTVQMVTKRGGNQYHGVAYGSYYGSNWGGANTWANNHTASKLLNMPYTPLPVTHRSRFGGSLSGVLLPKMLGGKTYFFINYEGSRFPNGYIFTVYDPSMLLRAGVIQVANSAGQYLPYNLNPNPVTVAGVTYQPAMCGTGLCDPRGIGISPAVQRIYNMMPPPNEFQATGDTFNTQGYDYPIKAPLNQNSEVIRIDHSFSPKERFFGSYRHTIINNTTANQYDIGGAFAGDKMGVIQPLAVRPQHPSLLVFGLTSNLKPTVTNDFRFSYTRNQWQWFTNGSPPQFAGLGGAIEVGGESATGALTPYNVNESSVRTRMWDGQDKFFKDDMAIIRGTHLFQLGGSWLRDNIRFQRNDNPQGIISYPVYQVTSANTNFQGFQYPSTVASNQQTNWNTYYAYVLGMVSQSQMAQTRDYKFNLQPAGASGMAWGLISTYNLYISDTWRAKPGLSITYGINYMIQMPPKPLNGDPNVTDIYKDTGQQMVITDYMAQRQKAALAGQATAPVLAVVPLQYVAGKPTYAYDPYYKPVSPRVAVAWTPTAHDGILSKLLGDKKTVIRAGYGRIYGRLNAIKTLSAPMQGPGQMQSITCAGPSKTGQCTGNNGVTPSTVFRIGPDGLNVPLPAVDQVLQEPYLPGINGNAPATDFTIMDKLTQPQRADNFNLSISRQLTRQVGLDVGYTGKIIRKDLVPMNMDSVPYMMTLGGQTFAQAYANTYWATPASGTLPSGFTMPAQPFFESALGGANSAYCQGYANCTSAVAVKNTTAIRNTAVSDLWTAMYNAPSWTLGRSMISQPLGPGQPNQGYSFTDYGSIGYANYNSLYVTARLRDYHGFSGVTNFTWGRALGTPSTPQSGTAYIMIDGYNLKNDYNIQSFDYKFLFNFSVTYAPKAFASQKGVIGHVLGGWRFAPIFTSQSGAPNVVYYSEGGCTGCQAYGEVSTASSGYKAITENAVAAQPYAVSTKATYNNFGTTTNGVSAGSNNPTGVNMFKDPAAVIASFRKCVLGYDWTCGGYAMRGLPYWNMDAGLTKTIKVWREGTGVDLRFNFTNLFNHVAMSFPTSANMTLSTPTTFGKITGVNSTPRQMQVGLRVYF